VNNLGFKEDVTKAGKWLRRNVIGGPCKYCKKLTTNVTVDWWWHNTANKLNPSNAGLPKNQMYCCEKPDCILERNKEEQEWNEYQNEERERRDKQRAATREKNAEIRERNAAIKEEKECNKNAIEYGLRLNDVELKELTKGKKSRLDQRESWDKLIPKLLVDAFVDGKCTEDEMLEIWGVFDSPDTISGDARRVCSALITICGDNKRLPKTINEGASWEEIAEGIWQLANAHEKLVEFAVALPESQHSKEDLEFLINISEENRHPILLDYILDEEKDDWDIESARDLLETKGFDDYPDAVIEVLDGANWKAAAAKRGLLQL